MSLVFLIGNRKGSYGINWKKWKARFGGLRVFGWLREDRSVGAGEIREGRGG